MFCSDSLSWATGLLDTGPSVCFSAAYIDFYLRLHINEPTTHSLKSEICLLRETNESMQDLNHVLLTRKLGTRKYAWRESDKWCWYPELPVRVFRLDPTGLQLFPFGEQTSFYVITRSPHWVLLLFPVLFTHVKPTAKGVTIAYDQARLRLYFKVHVWCN